MKTLDPYLNLHAHDFGTNTIEWNVKNPRWPDTVSEENGQFESETGFFTNIYAQKCVDEIQNKEYRWLKDWSFAGRSNGWFVLLTDEDPVKINFKSMLRVQKIISNYFNSYGSELAEFYKDKEIED